MRWPSGISSLEQYLLSAGGSRRHLVRHLYLPALIPTFQSNLSLGFGLSLKVVILGEFIGAQEGLGYLLNVAAIHFDMKAVLVLPVRRAAGHGPVRDRCRACCSGCFWRSTSIPNDQCRCDMLCLTIFLSVKHLTKRFGTDSRRSSRTCPSAIPQGERVTLFAPSGAGKTTLINILTGLDRADAGGFTLAARATRPRSSRSRGCSRT